MVLLIHYLRGKYSQYRLKTQPNKQLMFAARVHVDKSIKSDGLSGLF